MSEESAANEKSDADDDAVADEGYVVAVKPSARKSNAAVGRWVNRNGPTRRFPSKAHAREWARECAGPGAFVWIQDAVPWDDGETDGYLVGGSRWPTPAETPPGNQATLEDQ
ncbi:hypothetical protein OB920_11420 [Halobacteria archaeon HArc-gm2]|nr:hypothetical protein [Halobacteria archaeon HArc-gm2]